MRLLIGIIRLMTQIVRAGHLGRTQVKVTIEPAVAITAGFCLALF
jgi:hypothetical protein